MRAIAILLLNLVLLSSPLDAFFEGSKNEDSFVEEVPFFVTTEEFCSFLNEVAAADPHCLYEEASKQVLRFGGAGSYHYEVIPGEDKKPLPFLNKFDANRYFNWMSASQKSIQEMENSKEGLEEATEQGVYEFEGEQLLQANNDAISLLPIEHPGSASSKIDPLLRSSEISVHLSSPDLLMQGCLIKKENLTWDSLRVAMSALITIGTLFKEGHFSLEEARRSVPCPRIDYSVNPRIESTCYSEDAVLESLKAHDPVTRFQAEQELLKKRSDTEPLTAPLIDQAVVLEALLQDASNRTFLGQMNETRSHLIQGVANLGNWVLYTLSPILDNGRRITAGGVIGYALGATTAYFTHGSSFAVMSDGSIGAYAGGLLFGGNDLYNNYTNWQNYREAGRERYDEIKKSFAAASTSFWNAWDLEETKKSAEEARCIFYEKVLGLYREEEELANSPEHARLLLEAQAHQIIKATEKGEKMAAFDKFLEMGEKFFGWEIMEYAFPLASRATDLDDFNNKKDQILARIRCVSISMLRQWYKDSFPKDLEKITKDLKEQANKVIKASEKEEAEAFHQFITLGEAFYGPEMIEEICPEEGRATLLNKLNKREEITAILEKMCSIQVSISAWQEASPGSEETLKKIKEDIQKQIDEIIKAPKEEQMELLNQFLEAGETLYGPTIIEHFFPGTMGEDIFLESSKTAALAKLCEEDQIMIKLHRLYLSRLRQQQKLLEDSKTKREPIHGIFSELSQLDRSTYITRHIEELRGHAQNEVEKLISKKSKDFQGGLMRATYPLAYQATLLGVKVITMSTLGFLTGSFIGKEIPISFSSGDLYHPWVAVNNAGFAYGTYFAVVGLVSQNTIRQSARKVAAAYAHLSEIWNNDTKLALAHQKLAIVVQEHENALKNTSKNVLSSSSHQRSSLMPGTSLSPQRE